MEILALIAGVLIISAVGSSIAFYFMFRWVQKIIQEYVAHAFEKRYQDFIEKFIKLYKLHGKEIRALKNEKRNKKTA